MARKGGPKVGKTSSPMHADAWWVFISFPWRLGYSFVFLSYIQLKISMPSWIDYWWCRETWVFWVLSLQARALTELESIILIIPCMMNWGVQTEIKINKTHISKKLLLLFNWKLGKFFLDAFTYSLYTHSLYVLLPIQRCKEKQMGSIHALFPFCLASQKSKHYMQDFSGQSITFWVKSWDK